MKKSKKQKIQELLAILAEKLEADDWQGIIATCDRGIKLDKNNIAFWAARGLANSELKHHKETIIDFDEAIKIFPNMPSFWVSRGLAKNDLWLFEEAIVDFDEAINLDKNNAVSWAGRGHAKNQMTHYEEAIADFDEAIKINKNMATAWARRGFSKNALKHFKEASVDCEQATKLNPTITSAWLGLGYAKSGLGHFEEAIVAFDEAIKLDGAISIIWMNRGFTNYKWGKYDEAEADLTKALKLSPDEPILTKMLLTIKSQLTEQKAAEKSKNDMKETMREATEDIKMSIKEQVEVFTGNSEILLKQSKRRDETVNRLNFLIIFAWMLTLSISIFYYWFMVYINILNFSKDLYYNILLPLSPPPLIILFPFRWGIKMLSAARDKNEIMREDFHRRAMADVIIHKLFSDPSAVNTPEKEKLLLEIMGKYIEALLNNSSAEMLLQYSNKKNAQRESFSGEGIMRELREFVKSIEDISQ